MVSVLVLVTGAVVWWRFRFDLSHIPAQHHNVTSVTVRIGFSLPQRLVLLVVMTEACMDTLKLSTRPALRLNVSFAHIYPLARVSFRGRLDKSHQSYVYP